MMLWLLACATPIEPPTPAAQVAPSPPPPPKPRHLDRFRPLPVRPAIHRTSTQARIDLGRRLYNEAGAGPSCNSCHDLRTYGVDGKPTAKAHGGKGRNTPSTFNAALQEAQFWDGRSATVELSAMPTDDDLLRLALADPSYVKAFGSAFPHLDPVITRTSIGQAIAAFERGLISRTRFDTYLEGKHDALTPDEQAGLEVFVAQGCAVCHFGSILGGNVEDGAKIPGLRNVTQTGPWLHDGSATDLGGVVRKEASRADKVLSNQDVASILVFFGALEGAVDPTYLKERFSSAEKVGKPSGAAK